MIYDKFSKNNTLATKEDFYRLEKIISEMQVSMKRQFNNLIMCTVGTSIGITGILITAFKLLIEK